MSPARPATQARIAVPVPPGPAALVLALGRVLAAWEMRAKTRAGLRRLDAHACRDIGLSPEDARTEAAKPFWKD